MVIASPLVDEAIPVEAEIATSPRLTAQVLAMTGTG
jgi:hypothetical protein